MKKFTTAEIRDLYGQVTMGEISFSRMVEILNERVVEANEPQYKDGDFVINMAGDILIFREKVGVSIYDHAYLTNYLRLFIRPALASTTRIERHTTEEEKQRILNALAKEGKRWNAEKKCVEDIPVCKFKKGDKVRIKDGISSKTHSDSKPNFVGSMDELR